MGLRLGVLCSFRAITGVQQTLDVRAWGSDDRVGGGNALGAPGRRGSGRGGGLPEGPSGSAGEQEAEKAEEWAEAMTEMRRPVSGSVRRRHTGPTRAGSATGDNQQVSVSSPRTLGRPGVHGGGEQAGGSHGGCSQELVRESKELDRGQGPVETLKRSVRAQRCRGQRGMWPVAGGHWRAVSGFSSTSAGWTGAGPVLRSWSRWRGSDFSLLRTGPGERVWTCRNGPRTRSRCLWEAWKIGPLGGLVLVPVLPKAYLLSLGGMFG